MKLDVNSSLKGSAELNADEMAKIKSGDVENVDYANLVTASLTTSNSVKYDLKTTINSNESYVTTEMLISVVHSSMVKLLITTLHPIS